MNLRLKPHPDSPAPDIRIEVDAARSGPWLRLDFQLFGDTSAVKVPNDTAPARQDGLWQSTCFEAFVAERLNGPYFELNLSPSSEWAAYRFDSYRTGMQPALEGPENKIFVILDDGILEVCASFDFDDLPELSAAPKWHLALSAVIEEANGRKSYWALDHPPGKADFHHPDSFAHEL
jgi:hypothetical protein